MDSLPIEILQCILDLCDFLTQIRLTQICMDFHRYLKMIDFLSCDIVKYRDLLTDDILKNYKYIVKLNICGNKNVKNIGHLIYLRVLWANSCVINDSSLKNMNLVKLSIHSCPTIKNINHMTKLKKLIASGDTCNFEGSTHGYCGINDASLHGLNLIKLDISRNFKIKDINHLTKLRKLSVLSGCSKELAETGMRNLTLDKLNIGYNWKIKDIRYMTSLKKLNISGNSGVSDESLQSMNLIELNASGNYRVKNIGHMTNLESMDASGNYDHNIEQLESVCGVEDADLQNLNLIHLYPVYNKKITTKGIEHMTRLVNRDYICTDDCEHD